MFANSGSPNDEFYTAIFRSFDPQNFGTVQGGQVFGFFLSSGLNKSALGDIWDEATQKQSGGLTVSKFINAMKLIALAQKGIAPKLANIASNAPLALPQMAYPANIKKPQLQQAAAKQAESDPFGGLTKGLGFDPQPSTVSMPIHNNNDNMNNGMMEHMVKEKSPPIIAMDTNKALLTKQDSTMSVNAPGLNRRLSSKILYQEERLREQVRAAEQREKLAKKQANDQRIDNERLERENEQLKFEINTARQAQAEALKQSQSALTSIQPLRAENDKLKQAINQWKELITTKDEELEALESEVDQLRLQNEKLENIVIQNKSKIDDQGFKLERSQALLQELKQKIMVMSNK